MSQRGIVVKWIFLLCVVFLPPSVISCAPVQTKSTGGQVETKSVNEDEKEMWKGITQELLQTTLMGFADSFATKFSEATSILLEQEPSPNRVYAAGSRFATLAAAFDIAAGRYPRINLVDMVTLVTLTKIVWKEYWQPEVFGGSAQGVIETLRQSEEDVWTIAAAVLTPEQQEKLRALIQRWRENNPDQQSVSFVRLINILEVVDKDSVFQKEIQSGGLFAPVTEATRAVDEIRFSAERAMYLLSRMQATLGLQIEMVYHSLATQREVSQVLSDITGFRETVERLPAQISRERKNLMQDLEYQKQSLHNVLTDIRQTMSEGNDLVSLVNETTKTVDSTTARIESIIFTPVPGSRPFNILEYYNTVLAVSDTAVKFQSLLDSLERLIASPDWEQRMPMVLKLAANIETESEQLITHAFIYGAVLVLIFFLALFLTLVGYRYVSKRLKG